MASRLAYVTALGSVALLMGACIIKSTTNDDDDTHTTTTTTTPTGEGGSGGSTVAGGNGGVGGQIPTGGSGGESCVDSTGSGVTVTACDQMNITPETHGGAATGCVAPNYDQDPPGYLICVRGFEIYTDGQAEDLQGCLGLIGVQDACDAVLATACVEQMYVDACPRQEIVDTCNSIQATCDPDPFDAVQCAGDLNPFSDAGLTEMTDCINGQPVEMSCQDAYDACFQTVASA